MSKKIIYALTDYRGFFGSKHFANPYRSGMDKGLLRKHFKKQGYNIEYLPLSKVKEFPSNKWVGEFFIYTSSEDPGYYYKGFIEDIVYYLEEAGARVIPSFRFMRANNNKVFMELLRHRLVSEESNQFKTRIFGSLEEVYPELDNFIFPVVVKKAEGSMGKKVTLVKRRDELVSTIRQMTKTGSLKFILKERIRQTIHKGYEPESPYRNKFIIQNYIAGLKNDWKVYVMGDVIYIFYRPIFKKRMFKASGGGYDNYSYGLSANIPEGILDFAFSVFKKLDVPSVSLDIGYDEQQKQFYLFEFQAVYYGTAGMLQHYSKEFFIRVDNAWEVRVNNKIVEEVYAESVTDYINKKF